MPDDLQRRHFARSSIAASDRFSGDADNRPPQDLPLHRRRDPVGSQRHLQFLLPQEVLIQSVRSLSPFCGMDPTLSLHGRLFSILWMHGLSQCTKSGFCLRMSGWAALEDPGGIVRQNGFSAPHPALSPSEEGRPLAGFALRQRRSFAPLSGPVFLRHGGNRSLRS
jgi:hypothetical protein